MLTCPSGGIVASKNHPTMKAFRLLLAAVMMVSLSLLAVAAKTKGSSGGAVHVKGYTRKDGTYVAPHTRSAPNHTRSDNWSTKGNVNPYTVKVGTKPDGSSGAYTAPVATTQTVPGNSTTALTVTRPSGGWANLRAGMSKAEVTTLLGEPNIKTAGKWVYTMGGTVRFDDKGLLVK